MFVFLCPCARQAFAQKEGKPLIDSLVGELAKMQDDTNKVNMLDDISYTYYSQNPDKGVEYGLQCLALAQQLGWQNGIGRAYRCIGINYENKGLYPKALEYFMKSLRVNEEMRDQLGIAKSLSNIGIIYDDQKQYSEALKYYSDALKIFTRLNYKPSIAINLGNIALVYRGLDNIPKALQYDSMALQMYKELNDNGGITRSIGNMGIHFLAGRNYDQCLDYSLKALKMYEEEDNKYGMSLTYGIIGEAYYQTTLDTAFTPTSGSAFAGSNNARLTKAAAYLANSIAIARKSGYLNIIFDNGNIFAKAQEGLGNYKEALAGYRQYAELKDSVFNDESRVKIENLITQRELDIKDKQIIINKLAVHKKRNERIFFITGITLLLVVLVIIGRNYRIQKKLNGTIGQLVSEQEVTIQQRTADLKHTNKKLIDLIQFNAHNVREPLTRIMGTMMLKDMLPAEEFMEEGWPMLQQSVNDLDNTLKKVIGEAEQENK